MKRYIKANQELTDDIVQHMTRKQNLTSMCYPFITPLMQEDYDRYKAEYSNSEVE